MDAIITIDRERHITLFNAAAERVFGCAASWAVGQALDRFLSPMSIAIRNADCCAFHCSD